MTNISIAFITITVFITGFISSMSMTITNNITITVFIPTSSA